MIWVEITLADVIAHLPTDIKTRYDEWISTYPEKADRLATLTENTIREFRDAIKSNPANQVDARETWLPQSAIRHAENIIIFNLAMEMGVVIDSSGNSARTSADVFLRQIPYGRWNTTLEGDNGESSPRYTVPVRSDFGSRALPVLAALMLMACTACAGWIKPGSTLYDADILTTFIPSQYTNIGATVYGHLFGINTRFASVFDRIENVETDAGAGSTGAVLRTGSTMSGPLVTPQVRGTENTHLVIEAGGAISFPPTLYLRAGSNLVARGDIKISADRLQAEDFYDFHIQGGFGYTGKNVILEGGEGAGNAPYGKVVLRGETVIESTFKQDARIWVSTNSYLAPLGSITSLYFVTVQPPSTNRIDL